MTAATALVNYDQARIALHQCVRVDDAAKIRDKAEKLRAYARMRDDADMEVWVSEIKVRACTRIGELSRDLDKVKPRKGLSTSQRWEVDDKAKRKALADAGISTSTANRYEELVGGTEKNAIAAAAAATEGYFAEARQTKTPATMQGLKTAVRKAVTATVGPKPKRKVKKRTFPKYDAWLQWAALVEGIAGFNKATMEEMLAETIEHDFIADNLRDAEVALGRLKKWIATLKKKGKANGQGKG